MELNISSNIEHLLRMLDSDSKSGKTLIMTTHTRNFDFLNLQAQQLEKHIRFPVTDVPLPLVSEENVFRGVKQVRNSFNQSIEYFWGGYF